MTCATITGLEVLCRGDPEGDVLAFLHGEATYNLNYNSDAPIGTQGAQFTGSTFGYYKIKVTFDVNATADAEANLQVQYSTDGSHWFNANIASAASGVIANNSSSANTVNGAYLQLVSGWNNQVTVDLSGISGVDNDASFAIRIRMPQRFRAHKSHL